MLPTWRKTRPVLTDWESRDLISRGSRFLRIPGAVRAHTVMSLGESP